RLSHNPTLLPYTTLFRSNYTEEDVRQSAKALAGWQIPPPDSTATVTVDQAKMVTRKLPVYSTQRPGVFNQRRAYKGTVTFLGHTDRKSTRLNSSHGSISY